MKKDNPDLRVQRTKRILFETFSDMLEEMDYDAITISELASRAGISRKTFYLHYGFLDELRQDFVEHIASELIALVKTAGNEEDIISSLFLYFRNHGNFVIHIYQNHNRDVLQEALLLASREIYHADSNAALPVDFKYITASLLNYFLLWYEGTDHSNAEDAAHHIARMLLKGVRSEYHPHSQDEVPYQSGQIRT